MPQLCKFVNIYLSKHVLYCISTSAYVYTAHALFYMGTVDTVYYWVHPAVGLLLFR